MNDVIKVQVELEDGTVGHWIFDKDDHRVESTLQILGIPDTIKT